ncbi:MAG TPA: 1-acyl-sn-glycerol-3-phosphate acyltransferase [Cyanobacteria bacterium UBA9971]|nr:1-acyl-sn-glycerol-3-phosphate acyltransferase [Cyanobacteria bacterium UBA9971]
MIKFIFFWLFVKPLVYIVLGINVRKAELIPKKGPVIIAANHNSHIDTLILMSLFPLRQIFDIHPVAAADYFLKTKFRRWFFLNIFGIIPISRDEITKKNPFEEVNNKLKNGKIIIIYPEGTRGEPEVISEFKCGVAHLAKQNPDIPVIPVFMSGTGKVLPKDEGLLVPFICDVYIGQPLFWCGDKKNFMDSLKHSFEELNLFNKKGEK